MMFYTEKNRIKRKLLSRKGDSIAEVLIALLIAALALVMLASMITASANMITRSNTFMNTYYTDTNALNVKNPIGDVETINVASSVPGMKLSVTVPSEANPVTKEYAINYKLIQYQGKKILSFWKA